MPNDKPPTCPKCRETTLDPNEFHSGLKADSKMLNGKKFLVVYCANCGTIVGIVKD